MNFSGFGVGVDLGVFINPRIQSPVPLHHGAGSSCYLTGVAVSLGGAATAGLLTIQEVNHR